MRTGLAFTQTAGTQGVYVVGPVPAGSLFERLFVAITQVNTATRYSCGIFSSRPRTLADFQSGGDKLVFSSLQFGSGTTVPILDMPIWERIASPSYLAVLVDNSGAGNVGGNVHFQVRPPVLHGVTSQGVL